MDDLKTSQDFYAWMQKNTNLLSSSIALYYRTIKSFLEEYSDVTLDNINDFVSRSFRDSNSSYKKYAFRPFLKFYGKQGLYKKIVPVRTPPRKKYGKYISEALIIKLIQTIEKDLHRDWAMLQYATGARAHEIISLKEENIDFDYSDEVIRLRLIGKRSKERISFLAKKYEEILRKYLKDEPGFLFLSKDLNLEDDQTVWRYIENQRTYFYVSLKKAREKIGLDHFGTHDFRRNVAEIIRKRHKDPYLVKNILGHSDIRTTLRYFEENPEDVQEAIISHQAGGM